MGIFVNFFFDEEYEEKLVEYLLGALILRPIEKEKLEIGRIVRKIAKNMKIVDLQHKL